MDDLQLASNFMCQRGTDFMATATEAILCKRIKELTKQRDELISEERELIMAVKQRKDSGKNIRTRFRSIQSLNHPKTIRTTELTPLDTLEKRKRNISASLTILGRQLVTLDQQIIDARDRRIAEMDEKSSLTDSQESGSISSITSCQITLQLVS